MALELEKSSLNINQIVSEKNVTDVIDSDCIVPDVKPDILEIVGTSGVVNIYKKELTDGKIRIDGSVQTYTMYYGEDSGKKSVRSINHTLDFSEVIQLENASSDMIESTTVKLQSVNAKIINERKISIKASVNYNVRIFSNSNQEYVNNVKLKDIQKKEKSLNVKSVVGVQTTKTSVSENLAIDPSDQFAEILKVTTSFSSIETKISYNKVLTKADLNMKMLYLTEDGRVSIIKKTFPIMGFVDMKDIKDESTCESELEMKNMVIKPSASQDHTITVDFEIGMKVFAYENKTINVIEDLYSPSKNLSFKQKNITAISGKATKQETYSFNQKQNIGITNERVLDIDSNVIADNLRAEDGTALVNGNIEFNITTVSEDSQLIQLKKVTTPFVYKMPIKDVTQKTNISLKHYVSNENHNVLPGGDADFRMDIVFVATTTDTTNIRLIEKVEEMPDNERNKTNMVIYFTKDGDSLWNIAKNFRSTVDNIKEVNSLPDDKIQSGTQLFIIS